MLDKNIKDYEASVELLEDRKKTSLWLFMFFYITGAFLGLLPVLYGIPLSIAIPSGFAGVVLLIIATWFLIFYRSECHYIFLIKKGVVPAKEKRP